jgi:hypothetical protein
MAQPIKRVKEMHPIEWVKEIRPLRRRRNMLHRDAIFGSIEGHLEQVVRSFNRLTERDLREVASSSMGGRAFGMPEDQLTAAWAAVALKQMRQGRADKAAVIKNVARKIGLDLDGYIAPEKTIKAAARAAKEEKPAQVGEEPAEQAGVTAIRPRSSG